jgi:hypothetical protein
MGKDNLKLKPEQLKELIDVEKLSFYDMLDYFFETNNLPKIIQVLDNAKGVCVDDRHNIERTRTELSDIYYKYLGHKSDLERLKKW